MAGDTLVSGQNVIAGFAGSLGTVMAADAIIADFIVIKKSGCPLRSHVTIGAIGVNRYVIGRFTFRIKPVVAAVATTQYLGMVNLGDIRPLGRGMAIFTHIGTLDVVWWLAGRIDHTAFAVAINTLAGRTLKDPARVAGFALDASVLTVERKTGAEVVKILTPGFCRFGGIRRLCPAVKACQ